MGTYEVDPGEMRAAAAELRSAAANARGADADDAITTLGSGLPGSMTQSVMPDFSEKWVEGIDGWATRVDGFAEALEGAAEDAERADAWSRGFSNLLDKFLGGER